MTETVPLKNPIESYLGDLSAVCAMFAKAADTEAEECLKNVREKLLTLEVPPERMAEVLAAIALAHKDAVAVVQPVVAELLYHFAVQFKAQTKS